MIFQVQSSCLHVEGFLCVKSMQNYCEESFLFVCLYVFFVVVFVVIFTEMHLIPSSFTRISGIPGLYWGKMRSASKLCWCCRGLITERSGGGKKVNLDKIKTQKPSPAHHFSRKFSFGEGC